MADDRASKPGTEPFVPDFEEDTGTQSWVPDFSDSDDSGSQPVPVVSEREKPEQPASADAAADMDDAATEHTGGPVQPVTVPGRYVYLKWWKLVLVILGVWFVAAEIGLGLFYWWHHTTNKTPALFVLLVYVVACCVGGVMLAMVEGRPLISALSVAVMSGPFASIAAAAPLYGYYYCERVGHCLAGVIPY